MRLEDTDLGGLGEFTPSRFGFRVRRYHLEEPWGYIYATSKLLIRVDQRGPDYAQFSPPAGTVLFRRERYQAIPSCLLWVKTAPGRAFSSFYRPAVGGFLPPGQEPEEFFCEYSAEKATYHVRQDLIKCETELFIPQDEAVVVVTYSVTNCGGSTREVELLPVMRPHMAATSLQPWDVPSLYQRVGYSNDDGPLFFMELRSPAGIPESREYAFLLSDVQHPDSIEVDYARFVGGGTFENPEALHRERLGISGSERYRYGEYSSANSVDGKQGIVALRKNVSLGPSESFIFTQVAGSANLTASGAKPALDEFRRLSKYLSRPERTKAKRVSLRATRRITGPREIAAPDAAFNRYVNEYLPLQLEWVRILDRGWPTGMRGVRDSAQDATALVPLDPSGSRQRLLDLLAVQRSDGWFPRQYSIRGKHGTHDLRNYVDGGFWVWELLYSYLCYTNDFALLGRKTGFLDSDRESSVLEHAIRILEYYLDERNLGEHGLCLIRGGDWNDSINRAGLEGRGESVMVSCQAVLALKQAAGLLEHLSCRGRLRAAASNSDLREQADHFLTRAEVLKSDVLANALNDEGYLNGVFTDNGEWVFSPCDPDGRRRISIPVNAFGIISGVLTGDSLRRTLDILVGIKQADGWPLFYPPIGEPPIDKLGRIGQGDLAPGLGENGTVYNHGCHGFFGRAAAAAGEGDLLLEILSYMLPYDQQRHPIQRSKTAPYAVVNHYKTAPGVEGHGGGSFLTGSVSTALRNVYDGVFGIKPLLDGLALDPALPTAWKEASVRFCYLGADVRVTYERSACHRGSPRVIVDGREITLTTRDPVLGKEYPVIPSQTFERGKRYDVRYVCAT